VSILSLVLRGYNGLPIFPDSRLLFSTVWEETVRKRLIANIFIAIHVSRKELYLQTLAHSNVFAGPLYVKDRGEEAGDGLDGRSTLAEMTASVVVEFRSQAKHPSLNG